MSAQRIESMPMRIYCGCHASDTGCRHKTRHIKTGCPDISRIVFGSEGHMAFCSQIAGIAFKCKIGTVAQTVGLGCSFDSERGYFYIIHADKSVGKSRIAQTAVEFHLSHHFPIVKRISGISFRVYFDHPRHIGVKTVNCQFRQRSGSLDREVKRFACRNHRQHGFQGRHESLHIRQSDTPAGIYIHICRRIKSHHGERDIGRGIYRRV